MEDSEKKIQDTTDKSEKHKANIGKLECLDSQSFENWESPSFGNPWIF